MVVMQVPRAVKVIVARLIVVVTTVSIDSTGVVVVMCGAVPGVGCHTVAAIAMAVPRAAVAISTVPITDIHGLSTDSYTEAAAADHAIALCV